MVKGVNRRVVVVRPDGHGPFEQAIFLLREEQTPRGDIVREACRVADRYLTVRRVSRGRGVWLRRGALFLSGSITASLLWLAAWLIIL